MLNIHCWFVLLSVLETHVFCGREQCVGGNWLTDLIQMNTLGLCWHMWINILIVLWGCINNVSSWSLGGRLFFRLVPSTRVCMT